MQGAGRCRARPDPCWSEPASQATTWAPIATACPLRSPAERAPRRDRTGGPPASAKAATNAPSIAAPLEGLIDFDKESERLNNQIAQLADEKTRLDGQLSNSNFVERAPVEKVQELRDRQTELLHQIETLNNNLDVLN